MSENLAPKISNEEIKKFMEGRDPEERIVNLSYDYDKPYMTIFYRNELDHKCVREQDFYPFVWATREACDKLLQIGRNELKRLMDRCCIGVKRLRTTNSNHEEVENFKNGYIFMFYARKPMSYSDFLTFFRWAKNPVYSKSKDERQYLCVTPQEQFLISTGKRYFKGYDDYDQLLRMIFDLETEGLDPHKHRIKLNGVKLNRSVTIKGKEYKNWGRIFQVTGSTKEEMDKSELEVIDLMLKLIYTFKPDIITAHNGENFDWNFIIERCKELGTTMEEMSKKYFQGQYIYKEEKESILKLGGEIETFHRTIVPNTIITDSLHAVRRAQATDSNFKKADLKYSTKYLKLKKENRVYTPGKEIDNILVDTVNKYAFNNTDGDWYIYDETAPDSEKIDFKKGKNGDKPFTIYRRNFIADGYEIVSGQYIIERYLLDDLWECDKVEYTLNGTDFMLSKVIPVPFSKCTTMGTAGQWKAIMLAWSYENDLAIPLAANTGAFTGGLSRLLCVGYVGTEGGEGNNTPIIKLDYNSLYPSIILTWGISDSTDLMQAMLYMLEYVLTTREKYKGLKKKAGAIVEKYEEELNNGISLLKEQIEEYETAQKDYKSADNQQLIVKKLGNSYFGAYGSNNGAVFPWKSPKCAEQTTCTGRQSLRLMISHFHNLGYKPIVGDTDGFNFQMPKYKDFRYTKDNPYIGKGWSRETKEGKEYTLYEADVAEFNDIYMGNHYFTESKCIKMGLGIDEILGGYNEDGSTITGSCIQFARKTYADLFPTKPYPDDVKLVGNSIKSKKMPTYIEIFLDKAIRQLLHGEGQQFIEYYYEYLSKIYNYQIPLRDIASKGKIKKSVEEYKKDVQEITKAGRPKSRQAWYELAIAQNLIVDNGDTVYYVNTGKSKSHSDVKKITHYYYFDSTGTEVEFTKEIDRLYKNYKKEEETKGNKDILEKCDWIAHTYPNYRTEDEVILNCVALPNDIVNSEEDVFCNDENGIEYNCAKYIEMFNKRIKPLLVCFSREIRDRILVNNPDDKQYFTEEECKLSSGEPNKPTDQDTYEQLMTMEDKEIDFWMRYDMVPPFVEECKMGTWEEIKTNYLNRKERERSLGIDKERDEFNKAITKLNDEELNLFMEEGEIPQSITKIVDIDINTNNFLSKNYNDIVIGTIGDIIDEKYRRNDKVENDIDIMLDKENSVV